MLRVPQIAGIRYDNRDNGAQPLDDIACLIEPPQMGVAGGKIAICCWLVRILLDTKEKPWQCLIEATAEEVRGPDCVRNCPDCGHED